MSKFKVGDILIGTPENNYGITNRNVKVKVVRIISERKKSIEVVVLGFSPFIQDSLKPFYAVHRGGLFNVQEDYFEKVDSLTMMWD